MSRVQVFRTLVADPPWPFGDKLPGKGRGARKHYKCMSIDEIARFPLPPMARDSFLLLWRVPAMQQQALDVVRAWDFEIKSEIVWVKKTVHGKRWFGMGRYVRMEHETCLIATRGGRSTPVLNRCTRSTFEAPAGRHSAKPDAFYAIVRSLFPGPYVELFARTRRRNWTQFGDQLEAA